MMRRFPQPPGTEVEPWRIHEVAPWDDLDGRGRGPEYLDQFWDPVAEAPSGRAPLEHPFLRRWSAEELAEEDDEIRWIVNGVLTDDTFAIIAGPEKSLKTELGLNIVVAVASGLPCLGRFPVEKAGPVVCYVGEGGRRPFKRRLKRACESVGVSLADLSITVREGSLPIGCPEFQSLLEKDLADLEPVLLWVDPYYAYAGARVSSSQLNEVGAVLVQLSGPCVAAGAALVLNVHFNQGGSGTNLRRTSGAGIAEWADSWVLVEVADAEVENGRFVLNLTIASRQWGQRLWRVEASLGRYDDEAGTFVGFPTWVVTRDDGTGSTAAGRKRNDDHARQVVREEVIDVLSDMPWAFTRTEVKGKVGGAKNLFASVWDQLRAEKHIVAEPLKRQEGLRMVTRDLWAPAGTPRPDDPEPGRRARPSLPGWGSREAKVQVNEQIEPGRDESPVFNHVASARHRDRQFRPPRPNQGGRRLGL